MNAADHPDRNSETHSGFWQAIWPLTTCLPVTSALSVAVLVAWAVAWLALIFVAAITAISLISLTGTTPPALNALVISDPARLAVWTAGGLGGIGLLIVILAQLRNIFRSLADGDPFVPENAKRLRRIAATVAAMELIRHLVATGASLAQSGQLPRVEINFVVWIAAAILVVLADVFEQGARLREDNKLTV